MLSELEAGKVPTKKTVRVDDSILNSKLRKLAKLAKVEEKSFMREQGALAARDLAKVTPPHLGTPNLNKQSIGSVADKKQGELALMSDLLQIFVVQEPDIIQWAYSQFGRGPIYKGRVKTGAGIALTLSEVRRHHYKNLRKSGRTRPLVYAERLWVSQKIFDAYFKGAKSAVGTAKAALATSMVSLNPKQKVPAWIKRNMGRERGVGRLAKTGRGHRATISALAPGLQHTARSLAFVSKFRAVAMEKRLVFLARSQAKKAGFKLKVA